MAYETNYTSFSSGASGSFSFNPLPPGNNTTIPNDSSGREPGEPPTSGVTDSVVGRKVALEAFYATDAMQKAWAPLGINPGTVPDTVDDCSGVDSEDEEWGSSYV